MVKVGCNTTLSDLSSFGILREVCSHGLGHSCKTHSLLA